MFGLAVLMFAAIPEQQGASGSSPASSAGSPQTQAEAPAAVKAAAKAESKSCREMILSSSRLGMVKVCKTRAGWRRFEACHASVTRYCTPKRIRAKLERTAFQNLDDARIICRDTVATGSRLAKQRICLPKREWDRQFQEANDSVNGRIRAHSTMVPGG